MKRIVILIMVFSMVISSCGREEKPQTISDSGSRVSVSETGVSASEIEADTDISRCQITISTDSNCDITIPDPKECIGKSPQILLYHGKKKLNKDNYKKVNMTRKVMIHRLTCLFRE